MMTGQRITLTNQTPEGHLLQAVYAPDEGMNLVSYRCGEIEVIDQATRPLFVERCAGLGALIGPHFHEQPQPPLDFDHSLFPHVDPLLAQGRKDPFSHGIARYVPWICHESSTQLHAKLTGRDLFQKIPLEKLEGQGFSLSYEARLLPTGLFIRYTATSPQPSVVGLHYYYAQLGQAQVQAEVEPIYRDGDQWRPLPSAWTKSKPTHLFLTLDQPIDYGFAPKKKEDSDHDYHLLLTTPCYELHVSLMTASLTETSFQLYRPQNSSYICIEPLSARHPAKPRLTTSTLEVKLQIFPI